MHYPRSDHSFDWHGFLFGIKMLAVFMIIASATRFGVLYTQSVAASSDKTPVVTQMPEKPPVVLSTTTPQRIIKSLTIADVVPPTGKFIVADLSVMRITLYQNGTSTAEYPILTKGKPGTPWETPAGYYKIQTKEENHL